jgi:hypothetical protein
MLVLTFMFSAMKRVAPGREMTPRCLGAWNERRRWHQSGNQVHTVDVRRMLLIVASERWRATPASGISTPNIIQEARPLRLGRATSGWPRSLRLHFSQRKGLDWQPQAPRPWQKNWIEEGDASLHQVSINPNLPTCSNSRFLTILPLSFCTQLPPCRCVHSVCRGLPLC